MSENTQAKLGKLVVGEEQRDAVHIAVIPAVAARRLSPGQHVGLTEDGQASGLVDAIGVVDPFLTEVVLAGETFWLFLYPNTVTSLRHHWTHPRFDDDRTKRLGIRTAKMISEAWLRTFIASSDCPDYDTVMNAATGHHERNADPSQDPKEYPGYWNSRNDGEYLHFGGRDAHGPIPPEFWDHVEVVTGQPIPPGWRASSFSCSC